MLFQQSRLAAIFRLISALLDYFRYVHLFTKRNGICTENRETSTGDARVCVYYRFSQIEIFLKRVNIRDVLASLTCIRDYSDRKERNDRIVDLCV